MANYYASARSNLLMKTFIITQIERNKNYYSLQAESKSEAIREVAMKRVNSIGHEYVNSDEPEVAEVIEINE